MYTVYNLCKYLATLKKISRAVYYAASSAPVRTPMLVTKVQ